MRTTALTGLVLWLCTLSAVAQHAKSNDVAGWIDAILARPEVARGFWGVEIEELDTGRVVYSHDADRLFTPASNTKLFTTAATLALIGPDYHFRTTVESATAPDKYGRLTGDLVLVGRGDPNLSGRALPYVTKTERPLPPTHVLEELADQVVARGVKVIDGDMVADDSFFVYERYREGWSLGDLVWQFGAPVSALAVNDNSVFLKVLPGERVGQRAFATVTPFSEYYQLENHVLTSAAGNGLRKVDIQRQPGSRRIEVWGSIPMNDPGVNEELAVEEPAEFCARLFWELLEKRGVVLYGRTRARHMEVPDPTAIGITAAPPAGGGAATKAALPPLVLAEHLSLPLAEDIRVINKVSQNLHAEMLLRLLGHERGGSASTEGGLEVLRGFLAKAGLLPEEYVFYDGSGLSRQNLVTPHATVKLLRYAATQSWGAEYIDSLPLAGVDGTLASRGDVLPASAVLHAKTGSLDHVKSLSGYLTTAAGQRLVISIFANNNILANADTSEVINQILREAARFQD